MGSMRIERDRYEQVLDSDLSDDLDDQITVDARGYSPEVADVVGEDYLEGDIVIFGPEQYEGGSGLLDDVYSHDDLIDGVTGHGPLVLDTELRLDYEAAEFMVEASIREDEGGYRSFEQDYERMRLVFDDLDDLDAGRMTESEYIDALMADVDQYMDLHQRFGDRELSSVLGRVPLDATQGRIDGQSMRLRDETIRIGSDVFSLDPVVEEHDDQWTLRHETDSVEGVLETTAGLSTVEEDIQVLIGLPDGPGEIENPRSLVPVGDGENEIEPYRDTPVMASLRTETGDVAVAVTDSIAIQPLSDEQTFSRYGEPPTDPSYTVMAEAEQGELRVYRLEDMELDQSSPLVAEADEVSLRSGSDEADETVETGSGSYWSKVDAISLRGS